jgi:exonuclease III
LHKLYPPNTTTHTTCKLATNNINGIYADTRIKLLEELLEKQDLDFVLLQEVTKKIE